jgi:hypothetical protein
LLPGPDDLLREAVTRQRINPGYRGASCWTGWEGSEQITNALDTLDHTIHEIREYVLAVAPDPGPADGDR